MANLPQIKTANVPMFGGMDLTTPHDRIKPGFVSEAQNFQAVITGGYQTIKGYERSCGNELFSTNEWFSITLSDVAGLLIGDIIKTSTGQAKIIAIDPNNNQVGVVELTGNIAQSDVITIIRTGDIIGSGLQYREKTFLEIDWFHESIISYIAIL
jgi:hypothetical protein